MDSLAFLDRQADGAPRPVYVLHGDEGFLKRRVLIALRTLVLGNDDDGFGLSRHSGDKANYSTVSTELASAAFFSPRRLVIVEDADPFVTRERAKLEKYLASPSSTGVLVLDVQTWPSNTRLYKLVPNDAAITCKAPAAAKLPEWCAAMERRPERQATRRCRRPAAGRSGWRRDGLARSGTGEAGRICR